MTVTYLDPTAEEGIPAEAYELFLEEREDVTIGLIANTFPDGTRFMDKLEAALHELMPHAVLRRYQKLSVLPMEADQLEAVRRECDAAIAAWGH